MRYLAHITGKGSTLQLNEEITLIAVPYLSRVCYLSCMTLILEKDKLIESFWQYRWFILQHRRGFTAKVLRKTQYKETRGKHKEIQPRDIIKAKNKGLDEFLMLKRGYKGLWKWYVMDMGKLENPPKEDYFEDRTLDTFEYYFGDNDLADYKTLLDIADTKQGFDHLIKLNYATLTWLSRNQPLTKSLFGTFHNSLRLNDELQFHFMKQLKDVDINKIKQKLRKWIEDDSHALDEELAMSFFITHFAGGEVDYIREIEHYCFMKAIKSKSKEKELFWYEMQDKLNSAGRYEQAREQAVELWKDSKRIDTNKIRAEYLQSMKIDLTELSYL